jgi:ribosomal protein S27E
MIDSIHVTNFYEVFHPGGALTFGDLPETRITGLARFSLVPAPYRHYILRTIPCSGCGHVQVIKFKLSKLEVVERCEACGRINKFERPMPGSRQNVKTILK